MPYPPARGGVLAREAWRFASGDAFSASETLLSVRAFFDTAGTGTISSSQTPFTLPSEGVNPTCLSNRKVDP